MLFLLIFLQKYAIFVLVIAMTDLFTRNVRCDDISFKYAKGISDRSGKEFHLYNEIILFLGGDAELISETVHMKLKPQTLVVIPKETYHQVVINGKQDEYFRCVFQFENTKDICDLIHESMQELFVTDCNKSITYLFSQMIELSSSDFKQFKNEITKSVLVLLLNEIRTKKSVNIENDLNDELTKQAIKYISDNLTDNISIDEMALKFNTSVSTLMHTFKKNMNISIYKYIIKKRLILAHSKISDGEQSTVVASECGFNDYSGFYRQYKKMFDTTPSKKVRK